MARTPSRTICVVVGEEHRDGPACHWPIWPGAALPRKGADHPRAWGGSPSPLSGTHAEGKGHRLGLPHGSEPATCPCGPTKRGSRAAGSRPAPSSGRSTATAAGATETSLSTTRTRPAGSAAAPTGSGSRSWPLGSATTRRPSADTPPAVASSRRRRGRGCSSGTSCATAATGRWPCPWLHRGLQPVDPGLVVRLFEGSTERARQATTPWRSQGVPLVSVPP
jgi:hypothetical protein